MKLGKEPQIVELELYDRIDDISEKIRSSAFEAYITLEGVFQGIIRIIGEEIASVFKELIDKSRKKCIYSRISLRKESGSWDELGVLVCNGVAIAAAGEIDDEKLIGTSLLEKIASRINENVYTAGVIEITEVPLDFVRKRLGINVNDIVSVKPEEKITPRKPSSQAKPSREIDKLSESREIAPATTIPVETSISKTAPLPISEARQLLPPHILPALGLTRGRREEIHEEKELKPIRISEALSIDQPILEFSDKMIKYAFENQINISQALIKGDNENIVVEVTVTRLGLMRKRDKMLSLANNIADFMQEIFLKNKTNIRKISVIVRHGYDAVKVTRELPRST